ncbi:hypothetical protein [Glycomyces buryatensis]|uniref:SH3 domain-containing protein n=1 Tax=Glycomyces buryatensis TaxID=2570927 RepID=A0A4S8Q080_9ACTN|nr:hypothetical protein [Glycomyces buryatensis]THV35772.1 hypothetical protein FAB82_23160 [Glycomyces buryatensis]
MAVVGRVKDGLKSGATGAWAIGRKLAFKIAVGAAIVVVAVALAEQGEGAASTAASRAALTDASPAAAHPALLTTERAEEQLMLCKYTVEATFGVSIFTETKMSAKRLARLKNGTEVRGSCGTTEGEKTIGCAGLEWETKWIRISSGDTVGWAQASCLEKQGIF